MLTGELQRARDNAVFPKDRHVTASDGTPIAYTVAGTGSLGPIVFVNGWTCSDAYWVGIGPRVMEAGYRAVFLDTRGHGESGLPRPAGLCARNLRDADVSPARLARDVLEVLDDAGIETAVLAGHSMGVQTIIECCRLAPPRVTALIPIAGTYENPIKTFANFPVLDRVYPLAEQLFKVMPFEALRPFIRRTAGADIGHRVVRLIRLGGEKVQKDDLAPHMAQIGDVNFSVMFRMMSELRRHRTAEFLPTMDVPVLVLGGRHDIFTPPAVQQHMADVIPNAEMVWYEDAGHMLPIEEPDAAADAILDFLARRLG